MNVDPIEKKPLFHFLPDSKVLSFGTVGCNLRCKHCQNWNTSQSASGNYPEIKVSPEEIVDKALENDCKSIAYTYNEPTIFYEFMLETAKIAKKKGVKNVMVSNGFINPEPLKKLLKYMDAVNVDLKGFNNKFYGPTTTAWMQPVLETIKTINESKAWLEITNLIIPTLNDDLEYINKMCLWIKKYIGTDTPLHFSAFHPDYELANLPVTPIQTLLDAHEIAINTGIKYVYIGNVLTNDLENTYCPKCKEILIQRHGFIILKNNIFKGRCHSCNEKIKGVFE